MYLFSFVFVYFGLIGRRSSRGRGSTVGQSRSHSHTLHPKMIVHNIRLNMIVIYLSEVSVAAAAVDHILFSLSLLCDLRVLDDQFSVCACDKAATVFFGDLTRARQ